MPSSVVAALRYNAEKMILQVVYMSGKVYEYKSVPKKIYEAMRHSSSKGIYLNKYIKGKYEFEKVHDE